MAATSARRFSRETTTSERSGLDGVRLKTLVHGERTLMVAFRIDRGAVIPARDHPQEQIGDLISGRLKLVLEDETTILGPGDG